MALFTSQKAHLFITIWYSCSALRGICTGCYINIFICARHSSLTVSLLGDHAFEEVIFDVANTVHLPSAVHTPVVAVSAKVKVT